MANYRGLTDPEFLAAVGVDAGKWAEAFCQLNPDRPASMDEGLMISWFANSMMAMHDHIKGSPFTVLPDGSAFFVAEVPVSQPQNEAGE